MVQVAVLGPPRVVVASGSFSLTSPCPSLQHLPTAAAQWWCLLLDVFELSWLHAVGFSDTGLFAKGLNSSSAKQSWLPSVVPLAGWKCLTWERCTVCKSNGDALPEVSCHCGLLFLFLNFLRRQMEVAWEVLSHFGQCVHAHRKASSQWRLDSHGFDSSSNTELLWQAWDPGT